MTLLERARSLCALFSADCRQEDEVLIITAAPTLLRVGTLEEHYLVSVGLLSGSKGAEPLWLDLLVVPEADFATFLQNTLPAS